MTTKTIAGLALTAMGLIGLGLGVEYSGWAFGIGLFMVFTD
jgi:hypothetical protein